MAAVRLGPGARLGGRRWPLGLLAALPALALFVCTAMIYASVRFLQEWASPLHGQLPAAGPGLGLHPGHRAGGASRRRRWVARPTALLALVLHAAGRHQPRLSLRATAAGAEVHAADGHRHPPPAASCSARWASWAARSTRASSSTAAAPGALRQVKWASCWAPSCCRWLLLPLGWATRRPPAGAGLRGAVPGLLAERWFFFAQANHPQNLYYQAVS
jgi:hypothetical protein